MTRLQRRKSAGNNELTTPASEMPSSDSSTLQQMDNTMRELEERRQQLAIAVRIGREKGVLSSTREQAEEFLRRSEQTDGQ